MDVVSRKEAIKEAKVSIILAPPLSLPLPSVSRSSSSSSSSLLSSFFVRKAREGKDKENAPSEAKKRGGKDGSPRPPMSLQELHERRLTTDRNGNGVPSPPASCVSLQTDCSAAPKRETVPAIHYHTTMLYKNVCDRVRERIRGEAYDGSEASRSRRGSSQRRWVRPRPWTMTPTPMTLKKAGADAPRCSVGEAASGGGMHHVQEAAPTPPADAPAGRAARSSSTAETTASRPPLPPSAADSTPCVHTMEKDGSEEKEAGDTTLSDRFPPPTAVKDDAVGSSCRRRESPHEWSDASDTLQCNGHATRKKEKEREAKTPVPALLGDQEASPPCHPTRSMEEEETSVPPPSWVPASPLTGDPSRSSSSSSSSSPQAVYWERLPHVILGVPTHCVAYLYHHLCDTVWSAIHATAIPVPMEEDEASGGTIDGEERCAAAEGDLPPADGLEWSRSQSTGTTMTALQISTRPRAGRKVVVLGEEKEEGEAPSSMNEKGTGMREKRRGMEVATTPTTCSSSTRSISLDRGLSPLPSPAFAADAALTMPLPSLGEEDKRTRLPPSTASAADHRAAEVSHPTPPSISVSSSPRFLLSSSHGMEEGVTLTSEALYDSLCDGVWEALSQSADGVDYATMRRRLSLAAEDHERGNPSRSPSSSSEEEKEEEGRRQPFLPPLAPSVDAQYTHRPYVSAQHLPHLLRIPSPSLPCLYSSICEGVWEVLSQWSVEQEDPWQRMEVPEAMRPTRQHLPPLLPFASVEREERVDTAVPTAHPPGRGLEGVADASPADVPTPPPHREGAEEEEEESSTHSLPHRATRATSLTLYYPSSGPLSPLLSPSSGASASPRRPLRLPLPLPPPPPPVGCYHVHPVVSRPLHSVIGSHRSRRQAFLRHRFRNDAEKEKVHKNKKRTSHPSAAEERRKTSTGNATVFHRCRFPLEFLEDAPSFGASDAAAAEEEEEEAETKTAADDGHEGPSPLERKEADEVPMASPLGVSLLQIQRGKEAFLKAMWKPYPFTRLPPPWSAKFPWLAGALPPSAMGEAMKRPHSPQPWVHTVVSSSTSDDRRSAPFLAVRMPYDSCGSSEDEDDSPRGGPSRSAIHFPSSYPLAFLYRDECLGREGIYWEMLEESLRRFPWPLHSGVKQLVRDALHPFCSARTTIEAGNPTAGFPRPLAAPPSKPCTPPTASPASFSSPIPIRAIPPPEVMRAMGPLVPPPAPPRTTASLPAFPPHQAEMGGEDAMKEIHRGEADGWYWAASSLSPTTPSFVSSPSYAKAVEAFMKGLQVKRKHAPPFSRLTSPTSSALHDHDGKAHHLLHGAFGEEEEEEDGKGNIAQKDVLEERRESDEGEKHRAASRSFTATPLTRPVTAPPSAFQSSTTVAPMRSSWYSGLDEGGSGRRPQPPPLFVEHLAWLALQHPAMVEAQWCIQATEQFYRRCIVEEEGTMFQREVVSECMNEHRLRTIGTLPLENFLRQWIYRRRAVQQRVRLRFQQFMKAEEEGRASVYEDEFEDRRGHLFPAAVRCVLWMEHCQRRELQALQVQSAYLHGVVRIRLQQRIEVFPLLFAGGKGKPVNWRLVGLRLARVEPPNLFWQLTIAEQCYRQCLQKEESRVRFADLTVPLELLTVELLEEWRGRKAIEEEERILRIRWNYVTHELLVAYSKRDVERYRAVTFDVEVERTWEVEEELDVFR